MQSIGDYLASVIRTVVGIVIGGAIGLIAQADFLLDVDTTGWEEATIGAAMSLWYAFVRWLELKDPRFGWLFGLPRPPSYSNGGGAPK